MTKRMNAARRSGLIGLGKVKIETKGVSSINDPDLERQQKPEFGLSQD